MYLSNTKQLMEKEKEALFTLKEEIKKVTTELRYKQVQRKIIFNCKHKKIIFLYSSSYFIIIKIILKLFCYSNLKKIFHMSMKNYKKWKVC